MRQIYTQFVILALNLANDKQERAILEDKFTNVKQLLGSYKGTMENSYLIEVKNKEDLLNVSIIANKYNQESVLLRDNENQAHLWYMATDDMTHLGTFTEVSQHRAHQEDGYTFDYATQKYYICV